MLVIRSFDELRTHVSARESMVKGESLRTGDDYAHGMARGLKEALDMIDLLIAHNDNVKNATARQDPCGDTPPDKKTVSFSWTCPSCGKSTCDGYCTVDSWDSADCRGG